MNNLCCRFQVTENTSSSPVSKTTKSPVKGDHKVHTDMRDSSVNMQETAEPEKELPEEGFTQSLVAQWRIKEQTTKQVPLPGEPTKTRDGLRRYDSHSPIRVPREVVPVSRSVSQAQSRGRSTERSSTVNSVEKKNDSSPIRHNFSSGHDSDEDSEHDKKERQENVVEIELGEGGISENQPIVLNDVVRESDVNDILPPAKLARSLAEKFETMSSTNKSVERQPSVGRKVPNVSDMEFLIFTWQPFLAIFFFDSTSFQTNLDTLLSFRLNLEPLFSVIL